MPFVKRIEIRWRDMDAFGHVNNAAYLTYLEEARDEFLAGLLDHETHHRVVIRHIEIDYLTGLTQDDDLVDVAVEIERVGGSSVVMRESVTAEGDGRVAAQARSVMVHTDPARAASAPFPDAARRALEAAAA